MYFVFMVKHEFEKGVRAFEDEFGRDAGAVMLDCANADKEFGGNLFARQIFADQNQDPFFGRCQSIDRGRGFSKQIGLAAAFN